MNSRNIISIIILFILSAFSAPNVNLVSPYIMRGFSKTYSVSFHPETIIGYYEIIPNRDNILELAAGIDTVKSFIVTNPQQFNAIGIKEKVEIGLSLFTVPVELFISARFRITFNVYKKGGSELFTNVAITPFVGISVSAAFSNSFLNAFDIFNLSDYSYISHYYGASIGTRKLVENKYAFELFVSPSYSFTKHFVKKDYDYSTDTDMGDAGFSFFNQTINIPIGFRYINEKRIYKFSIKSGLAFHFTVDKKITNIDDYSFYDDIVVPGECSYKSSYFSVFAELGFHFGAKRYNLERKKQLGIIKERL